MSTTGLSTGSCCHSLLSTFVCIITKGHFLPEGWWSRPGVAMLAAPVAGWHPGLPPERPLERPAFDERHLSRDVRRPEPGAPRIGQHHLCREQPLLAQVRTGRGPDPFEQGVQVTDRH